MPVIRGNPLWIPYIRSEHWSIQLRGVEPLSFCGLNVSFKTLSGATFLWWGDDDKSSEAKMPSYCILKFLLLALGGTF